MLLNITEFRGINGMPEKTKFPNYLISLFPPQKAEKGSTKKKMLPTGEKICWKKEEHERKLLGVFSFHFCFVPLPMSLLNIALVLLSAHF